MAKEPKLKEQTYTVTLTDRDLKFIPGNKLEILTNWLKDHDINAEQDQNTFTFENKKQADEFKQAWGERK